jgi:ABC-type Fe3+-hydroxamate transport system, periplasmic component
MKIQNLLSITFLIILAQPSLASNFPVTVESCGRSVTFDKAPQRAVIHDQNMSQMAFALQLQEKIVGLTGITGWYKTSQEFDKARGNIPELAAKNPTIENIISVNPDLFFAGWNYGMRINGDLTPVSLKKFDIPVLELTESCAHVRESVPDASMDLLYNDILRLGKVFGVEEKSINLINEWKKTLRRITKTLKENQKLKYFV